MAITIQQIASELGVSPMTVSYALRDFDRVAPETRAKVKALARKRGYRPNGSALAMRNGRLNAVGLVQSTNPECSGMAFGLLHAIQVELAEGDLRLVMGQIDDMDLTDMDRMPRILREWSVDGVLMVYTHHQPPGVASLLKTHRVPNVWVNSKFERDCVYPNDEEAFQRATSRLLELGHRRVMYLTFSSSDHYSAIDRQTGYETAMRAAGLVPRIDSPESDGKGQRVLTSVERFARASAILSRPDRPTAIVCYGGSDECYPIASAARELGLKLPRDLALVGVDDRLLDDLGFPIATLKVPRAEMGRQSVRLLMDRMNRPDHSVEALAVPMELLGADSLVPPAER